jgi:uncharacterized membrane protein (UPF0127 family)
MRRFLMMLGLFLSAPLSAWAADGGTLSIHTHDGKSQVLTIEIARTEQEREYGLMNRPSMAPDHGMLFDFGSDQPVYMWMKDTLIPLDMLFIDRTGRIAGIAARAVPMSTAIIASPGPVRAVLELNGGSADRLGIAVGDTIDYSLFKP